MKIYRKLHILFACLVLATTVALSSCSTIDENRDDCEVDFQARYRLNLITNEELEIKRVLGDTLSGIAADLREHLKDVFTDFGRDLGLHYYALPDSAYTLPLRGNLTTEMNASESSCEIFMPILDYMHLATANVQNNGPVKLQNQESCHGAKLEQTADDNTVASQHTGLYTGRTLFTGLTYGKHQYNTDLYIVNCADAIVLDPRTAQFSDVTVHTSGFANSFSVCDSIYHFENNYVVRSERVELHNTNWLSFCSVNLPSREPSKNTRMSKEVDEPRFSYDDSGEDIWQYEVYVTMKGGYNNGLTIKEGTITKTTLTIHHPLRPGQLKIILGWIDDRGVIHTDDMTVGTSINLDWNPGIEFEW